MSSTFKFDRGFQIGILSLLCQSQDFLTSSIFLIKSSYFEDKILLWIFLQIVSYFNEYKKPLTQLVLKNRLNEEVSKRLIKESDKQLYLDVIDKLATPVNEVDYIISKVVGFCRQQELKNIFLSYGAKIDSDDDNLWARLDNDVKNATNIGNIVTDLGVNYFSDYKERLRAKNNQETETRTTTGIRELDDVIGSGLKPGQLLLYLAGTGKGKSIGLAHATKANIVEGKKGIIYTLELSAEDIAERLDASWSAIPICDHFDKKDELEEQLDELSSKYEDNLYIKFFPTGSVSTNAIKAHLAQLAFKGFKPDFVVIDYLDLLKPTMNLGNEYSNLNQITIDLRGLAGELGVPIFSATQSNRAGNTAETVAIDNMSSSIAKAFVADILVSVNMTGDEKVNNRARLFMIKNRNGPTDITIPIANNYSIFQFYVPQNQVKSPQVTAAKKLITRRKPVI